MVSSSVHNIAKGAAKSGGGSASNATANTSDFIDDAGNLVGGVVNATISDANMVVGVGGIGAAFGLPIVAGAMGVVGKLGEVTKWNGAANVGRNTQTRISNFSAKPVEEAFTGRITRGIGTAFSVPVKFAGSAVGLLGFKNASSTMKEVPSILAKKPVGQGLMDGSFIAGSGLQMATGAMDFGTSLTALKNMAFEVTGKKFSTMQILMGDVPEIIKAERAGVLKSLAMAEGSGALSLGVTIKNAATKVSGLAWAAVIGAGFVGDMLIDKGALPAYTELSQAFKAGQPIPEEGYIKLLASASPELKKRGGETSAFTKALSTKYAEENASPAQIMQEISKDGLKARIAAVIAASEAAKAAAPVVEEKSSEKSPEKSHVAALSDSKKPLAHLAKRDREIVGANTAKLAANTQNGIGMQTAM